MTTPHLSDDDVRDLFSDHLEGALDEATRRAVDDALAQSPALAAEHRAFAQTLSALRALPRPEAPAQLVGKVRDRLASERRADQGAQMGAGGPPALPRAANDDVVKPSTSWWSPLRMVSGLAAAAAVVAFVAVAVPGTGGGGGPTTMLGAGLVAEAVSVEWVATGLGDDLVATAATTAGMSRDGQTFVGDRAAAARFFVELKVKAIGLGGDVSGAVPEQAERIVVTIKR